VSDQRNGTIRNYRRSVTYLVVLVLVLEGINLFWSAHEARVAQHVWCTTLVTLDHADQAAAKAPASQRPHGAFSFALIKDFHNLPGQLGCG
jgi:hypothetical protein